MNRDEFAQLSAERALHGLSARDEVLFAEALAARPDWALIQDADAQTASLLAETVAEIAPTPSLRARLLEQISQTPQESVTASTPPTSRASVEREPATELELSTAEVADAATSAEADAVPAKAVPNARRRWFALAASVAILVAIVGGGVWASGVLAPPASVVALQQVMQAPDARQADSLVEGGGTATVHWSAELGRAVVVAGDMDTLGADKDYELWIVRGTDAIPAGTFSDGSGTTVVEGELHAGDVIAITVEAAGGSKTGLPTTTPIVAIPTV